MVRFLVKRGASVNERSIVRDWARKVTSEPREKDMDRGGFTPLLYAAREGCVACVKELLAGRADINLPDPRGTTPLVIAIMNMQFDTAKALIEAGADIQLWDFSGMTPLYTAVDVNSVPVGFRADTPSTDRSHQPRYHSAADRSGRERERAIEAAAALAHAGCCGWPLRQETAQHRRDAAAASLRRRGSRGDEAPHRSRRAR